MFSLEDHVVNQNTQQLGRVIGYRHKIVNDNYEPTLKVLVNQGEGSAQRGFVVEDLSSAWSHQSQPNAEVRAA